MFFVFVLGTCYKESWKKDGYCDPENNNEGCDWDGGDCCGCNVDKKYCSNQNSPDCQCIGAAVGDDDGSAYQFNVLKDMLVEQNQNIEELTSCLAHGLGFEAYGLGIAFSASKCTLQKKNIVLNFLT